MFKLFFKSLRLSFSNNKLADALDAWFTEIKEHVLPALELNNDLIVQTELYIMLDKALRRGVPGYKGDIVRFLNIVMEKSLKERDDIYDIVDRIFKGEINKESLNYDDVILLQVISLFQFTTIYTRRFLLSTTKGVMGDPYHPVEEHELAFVKDSENLDAFIAGIRVLDMGFKDMHKSLSKVADVSYSPEAEKIVSRQMGKKADPLGTGFLPVVGHLVYWVGQVNNLYSVHVYQRAKEEKERLTLQVYYLEQEKAGADEEALVNIQKQIDFHNNTINKLESKIEDIEAE